MSTTPADIFGQNAGRLDWALADDLPALAEARIEHFDDSAREYHYKNSYLIWEQRFEAEARKGSDVERVTVRLSYTEPAKLSDLPMVEATTVAEVFTVGQASHFRRSWVVNHSVSEVVSSGIGTLVKGLVQEGLDMLPGRAASRG